MKKTLLALAALSAIAGTAQAQSSVTLYGLIDVGVRYENHAGANSNDTLIKVGQHLNPSRWGMRVTEDLGGGWSALANIEQRFTADDGAIQALQPSAWAQSFVGLKTPYGQLTMGRQYNILFDAETLTFVPAKTIGPYIDGYKPDAAMQIGARNDNMVKYSISLGGFTGELQVSAGEGIVYAGAGGVTTQTFNNGGKSYGAMARYDFGTIAVAGAYLEREFDAKKKMKGMNLGVGYNSGPVYLNAFYYRNELDQGLTASGFVPVTYLGGGTDNTPITAQHSAVASGGVKDRDLYSFGGSYLIGSAFTVGGQYSHMKQTSYLATANPLTDGNGKVDYFTVFGSYAFSKRTNVYAMVDFTKTKDGFVLAAAPSTAAGPTSRTGLTAGVLHRF